MKNLKRIILFFTLFISISLVSCKKKAVEIYPNITGDWYAEGTFEEITLSIDSDSNAEYVKESSSGYITFTGKAKVRGNTLKIGFKKFKMTKLPEEKNLPGTSIIYKSMVLDGTEFICYDL